MIYDARTHNSRKELARNLALILLCLAVLIIAGAAPARAVRLKDIASFSGMRNNELVGYGLVVGLSGTGDGTSNEFTIRSMTNMLEKMGVSVNPANLKPKNTAAVMVTAKMPTSARPGSPIDVTVSSVGDAKSLLGGVLLITPLRGLDGRVYAVAQGSMTLGGYSAEGQAATSQKNITTVGHIPNGATVEREVAFQFNKQEGLTINLGGTPDFGTVMQVVNRINASVGGNMAKAMDGATIQLTIPPRFQNNLVPLMASLENLDISPDSRAKVVVDEKTGTVVLGGNVRLTRVAVAHGNLQIVVAESPNVSQPGAFSGGTTQVTPNSDVKIKEQNNRLLLMEGATLQELVDGLNSVGATPRDLISVLRSLKTAGSLHADLEVL
ncbi:MAG: flagellar basal body P-ring protein FlgI [Humidesulfovibrio sp.]|uniref:flagellar basal body P-ring protein FlgI n=1 Tax=Humidesulfovibrio sp. TaxID=2910988 RepID=UPI0027F0E75D|nr:flagellar basal body P-ring protein FlgI [Humidesulfovibrio sp.]MDQ7833870.1 flagellar basal body P-ring protein FlgI [Humidesulfovibrio sp.]